MSPSFAVYLCATLLLVATRGQADATSNSNINSVSSSSSPLTPIAGTTSTLAGPSNKKPQQQQFSARQMATTGGIMGFLSSIIPGVVNSLMPLAVLFGLGALAVPALGLGMLLRESRKSDMFMARSYQGPTVAESLIEFYDKMSKVIESGDKKYKQSNKTNQY